MSVLKTYVALIVDKSGSMSSMRQQAVNHFNEQLQVLKEESNNPTQVAKKLLNDEEAGKVETHATLVTFNQDVDTIIFDDDVNNIHEFAVEDYVPVGMTALYDAVGQTIKKINNLPDMQDPSTSVLFVIVTDGEENSSKEFEGEQGRKKLKSMIDDLEATGQWTFTFLGANQDVMETAVQNLGISMGNTVSFSSDSSSWQAATTMTTNSMRAYYSARREGKTQVDDFYSDSDTPEVVTQEETDE